MKTLSEIEAGKDAFKEAVERVKQERDRKLALATSDAEKMDVHAHVLVQLNTLLLELDVLDEELRQFRETIGMKS